MSEQSSTTQDEREIVPTLGELLRVLPIEALRNQIRGRLADGHSIEGVSSQVTEWLIGVIDWRDAGVPAGRLGARGQRVLADGLRVLVEATERARRAPTRKPTPRPSAPTAPRPVPVGKVSELPDSAIELELGPDPDSQEGR